MTLKPNKISKKGRYIKGQSFVTLYASSFLDQEYQELEIYKLDLITLQEL
ncbi:hypothetical protein NWE60_03165 [Mycoplasmopsis felis]|nr:hypothetical protein [Mycoplasmopsis felis]WAM01568.1 hypothetical protein NWE60_03165 [Mycoplasmopsis felis]